MIDQSAADPGYTLWAVPRRDAREGQTADRAAERGEPLADVVRFVQARRRGGRAVTGAGVVGVAP